MITLTEQRSPKVRQKKLKRAAMSPPQRPTSRLIQGNLIQLTRFAKLTPPYRSVHETSNAEAQVQVPTLTVPQKRRPGRPRGSKNKTVAKGKEASAPVTADSDAAADISNQEKRFPKKRASSSITRYFL